MYHKHNFVARVQSSHYSNTSTATWPKQLATADATVGSDNSAALDNHLMKRHKAHFVTSDTVKLVVSLNIMNWPDYTLQKVLQWVVEAQQSIN